MSGAASAGSLHLRPVGLRLHGLGLHGLGLYGSDVHALGVRLREPDLHLQQQGICSVLDGPCHPSFCSVFQPGPCIPYYWPPLGENLQLTITTTDDGDPAGKDSSAAAKNNSPAQKGNSAADKGGSEKSAAASDQAEPKPVDSIGEMFAALRACWVPPPKDEARHGMQYTVRFSFKRDGDMIAPPFVTYVSHDAPADTRNVYRSAVQEALDRCVPLHFSAGMAGAVAGRPIAVRFVDNRTTDQSAH